MISNSNTLFVRRTVLCSICGQPVDVVPGRVDEVYPHKDALGVICSTARLSQNTEKQPLTRD